MGMWIELGVFLLVFVFAWHQLRDLKKERAKRQAQAESSKANDDAPPPV
jgi:sensor domain CHASE-containing protein